MLKNHSNYSQMFANYEYKALSTYSNIRPANKCESESKKL